MRFFGRISISFKLVVAMAVSVVLTTVAMAVMSYIKINQFTEERVTESNWAGVNAVYYSLSREFDGMVAIPDGQGGLAALEWPGMPADFPVDRVDAAQGIAGIDATIFAFDPATQEFVRKATTIQRANGERAVGTLLARGHVYDTMMRGEAFASSANILGLPYETVYVPVMDEGGEPLGILFAGTEVSAIVASTNAARLEIAGTAAVVLALVLGAGVFLTRLLLAPFARATETITTLADGEIDQVIPDQERQDEAGRIANALTELQSSMQRARALSDEVKTRQADQEALVGALSDGLENLANLDLTTRLDSMNGQPFPAEYEGLRVSFNQLADSMSTTLASIRQGADDVRLGARELNSASEDLSKRTESQAATLEESAAALEALSQGVQSAAGNASDAEKAMSESRQATRDASVVVDDAIEAMGKIERSSEQITQIISVIDDIAFQTNLLALNAGVEAARAGDAGRGFAVVASEVRALAQRSSESAQEIKKLISTSSDEVEAGSALVTKAGTALGEILSGVESVSELVTGIATAMREQADGVNEINAGVRDLDTVTQHNAAMAEETSASSETLEKTAESLSASVDRFTLAGRKASNAIARKQTTVSPIDDQTDDQAATGTHGKAGWNTF